MSAIESMFFFPISSVLLPCFLIGRIYYIDHFGSDWVVNQNRDSLASYIGHAPLTAFFAVAENESMGRIRYNLMQVGVRHFSLPMELYVFYNFVLDEFHIFLCVSTSLTV